MRKSTLIIIATGIFFMTSCSNEKSSKIVAEKFLNAYACGKYDEAKQYATKHTQRMVNVTSALSQSAPKNLKPSEYEIIECNEVGNKATVKYRVKGSTNSEVMYLIKRNETWLVGIKE